MTFRLGSLAFTRLNVARVKVSRFFLFTNWATILLWMLNEVTWRVKQIRLIKGAVLESRCCSNFTFWKTLTNFSITVARVKVSKFSLFTDWVIILLWMLHSKQRFLEGSNKLSFIQLFIKSWRYSIFKDGASAIEASRWDAGQRLLKRKTGIASCFF